MSIDLKTWEAAARRAARNLRARYSGEDSMQAAKWTDLFLTELRAELQPIREGRDALNSMLKPANEPSYDPGPETDCPF
jgi:hypothetical protein